MERGKLTNRELDELGKQLIAAGRAADSEIDSIFSNPRLYDGVLAKIAAAETPAEPSRTAWKPVAAMAVMAVLLSISVVGYLKFTGEEQFVSGPRVQPPAYLVNNDERPFQKDVEPPMQPADARPRPITAVITKPAENTPSLRRRKARPVPVQQADPVFYPIGLAERAEDAAIDGRVVRVEMPRSALFALGMDLPLENGTRAVKADLLVGADGIPRGIRLVE